MGLTKPRAYQIFDIDYKQSVRVITLTNITLTGGAPSSVDGVNLSAGDRVLVAGQSTGAQNGLYQVSVLGTGSDGTWIRSVDANQTGEVDAGMIVMVTEGEIYKDTQWKLTTNDPITIGVTALVFEQNSAFAFGNIFANGTAVLADIVGDTVTFTPANNLIITANATSDVITFSVSQSPDFTGNFVVSGTIGSDLIPTANVTYDLGNTTNRWNDIWLSNSTIYLGNAQISANATSLILTTPEGAQTVFSGSTANISASTVTATGNITGGNLITSGILSVTGNANVGNLGTAGVITATGNVSGGNLTTAGNVSANYFLGNVACASGIFTTKIFNGNSEANIVSAGGNLEISIGGVDDIVTVTSSGLQTTGTLTATGNITGGNISTAGVITATGNITGGNVTTAGQITATGNITGGNLLVNNNVVITGNLSVQGTETIFNVNTLTVNDKDIVVANNVTGGANVNGAGIQAGNPAVATWFFDNATTSWQSNIAITPTANGTLDLGGTSNRWGNAWVTTLTATGNANVGNLDTAGLITATGNITGGNLMTGGLVSATGNVTGNILKATGNIEIQNRGILFLNDSDNSNYIGLRSPATLTGNFVYIFPANYGNADQVLSTNGAGGLSWVDQGGGGGGGGATSYPNSTVQPVPGSTGNFDLSFNFVQTVQEIPFESTSTDPFGVNLGEVYSMMDPVGEVLEGVDLGVLT